MGRLNSASVPYCGIMVTVCVYLVGVLLNYVMPTHVFELVLNIASLGVLSTWAFLIICQMKLRSAINRGEAEAVAFRMPCAPFTAYDQRADLVGRSRYGDDRDRPASARVR